MSGERCRSPWTIFPVVGEALNRFLLPADTGRVTRGLGLILALISLAVVAGLLAMQSKTAGPTAPAVTQAEQQALAVASTAAFQPVAQILAVDYAQAGTYVGAQLPLGSGVMLAQATSSSYCLQMIVNGSVVHESGPGGSPTAGPC